MAAITVKMRDGSVREFKDQSRPGGSYSNRVKYEGAFAVITDEWSKRTAIPVELIAEVVEEPTRRW